NVLAKGHVEDAGRLAQAALSTGTDRVGLLLLLGDIFLQRGLAGEALERFRAVGTTAGNDDGARSVRFETDALRGAARALLELDRLDEALSTADRLLARLPGDAYA